MSSVKIAIPNSRKSLLRLIANGLFLKPWLTTVLGSLTAAYSAAMTAYGEQWAFFPGHEKAHGASLIILAVCTALAAVISSLYQLRTSRKLERDAAASSRFLLQLIQAMGRIVDKKLLKLHNSLGSISSRKTFHQCNYPTEQMENIMAACADFFRQAFNVDMARNELDITILVYRSDQSSWTWLNDGLQRTWKRCDPNDLFRPGKNTLASHCHTHGQTEFIPDKRSGKRAGRYTLSPRDEKLGPGSAYGFPVTLSLMGVDFTYVVSIVTYGKMLCDENDEQTTEIVETMLREFCRRLEIEIHLKTIKTMIDNK